MRNSILILIILVLVSSCSSIITRDKQRGHLYTGVNSDIYGIKCAWVKTAKQEGDTPWYILTPLAIGVSVILIIDMPFSLVADTLFIPFDLSSEKSDLRYTAFTECE